MAFFVFVCSRRVCPDSIFIEVQSAAGPGGGTGWGGGQRGDGTYVCVYFLCEAFFVRPLLLERRSFMPRFLCVYFFPRGTVEFRKPLFFFFVISSTTWSVCLFLFMPRLDEKHTGRQAASKKVKTKRQKKREGFYVVLEENYHVIMVGMIYYVAEIEIHHLLSIYIDGTTFL